MISYKDLSEAQQQAIDDWRSSQTAEYEFADNYRYAMVGNHEQESQYYSLQSNGCCGFVDVVLDVQDGTKLMFGFNYGH